MNEMGEILKGERLKQKLTLEDVSDSTHISISMLRNLENGNFELIGTPLLIRGFVKSYCSALSMDSGELLAKYEGDILACDRMEESILRYGVWSKSFHKKNRLGILVVLALAILLAGIVSGGAWLYNKKIRQSAQTLKADYPQQEFPADLREEAALKPKDEAKSKQESLSEARTDTKEPTTPATASKVPATEKPVEQPPAAESTNKMEVASAETLPVVPQGNSMHHLEAAADQKSWVRVVIDGKQTKDLMLQPGDKHTWDAQEKIDIVLGNAGGVSLKWDDEPVKFTVPKGRVLHLELPDSKSISGQKTP